MYRLRTLALAASCLLPFAASPVGAVTFSSSSYDAGVHVSAASTVVADAGLGGVSGTGGPAYNNSGGIASANQGATLAANTTYRGAESLQAGIGTSNASSDGATSATGTATLNNISFGMTNQLLATLATSGLLNLGASDLSSTTTVGIGANGLYGTGSSLIDGLSLTGSLVVGGIDGSLYSAPAANTVLLSLAGLKVILNEQIKTTSDTGLSMQTNAVHIALNNYALDGSLLNGDVILGHSEASIGSVPEPASWAMMIVGFGAMGSGMRRRRLTSLFAA